ncbi:MAG: hypothetical protein AAGB51_01910 [Planctomycetota bacterium]
MRDPIGNILVKSGLVTEEQINTAVERQEATQEPIGAALCALGYAEQERIDRIWANYAVVPALEEAIDRVVANRYSSVSGRKIDFKRLLRKSTHTRDMLSGAAVVGVECVIEGVAAITIGSRTSLDFEFSMDLDSGFAFLSDRDTPSVVRWIDLLDRNGWLDESGGTRSVKEMQRAEKLDSFEHALDKLFKRDC